MSECYRPMPSSYRDSDLTVRLARGHAYMEALGWLQARQRVEQEESFDSLARGRERARLISELTAVRKHLATHGAVCVLVMFESLVDAETLDGGGVVDIATAMADDVELQLSLVRSNSY